MLNRGLLGWVYGLTVLLGLVTLLFPAPSIEGTIGYVFTAVYGALLLVGGIACFIAIVIPNYKLELTFLWIVTGGYVVYGIGLWSLFADRIGLHDNLPPPYGPALALTVLCFFLFAKIALLIKKNNELVKAATHAGLD